MVSKLDKFNSTQWVQITVCSIQKTQNVLY